MMEEEIKLSLSFWYLLIQMYKYRALPSQVANKSLQASQHRHLEQLRNSPFLPPAYP